MEDNNRTFYSLILDEINPDSHSYHNDAQMSPPGQLEHDFDQPMHYYSFQHYNSYTPSPNAENMSQLKTYSHSSPQFYTSKTKDCNLLNTSLSPVGFQQRATNTQSLHRPWTDNHPSSTENKTDMSFIQLYTSPNSQLNASQTSPRYSKVENLSCDNNCSMLLPVLSSLINCPSNKSDYHMTPVNFRSSLIQSHLESTAVLLQADTILNEKVKDLNSAYVKCSKQIEVEREAAIADIYHARKGYYQHALKDQDVFFSPQLSTTTTSPSIYDTKFQSSSIYDHSFFLNSSKNDSTSNYSLVFESMNQYYDHLHHSLLDRVEQSLENLRNASSLTENGSNIEDTNVCIQSNSTSKNDVHYNTEFNCTTEEWSSVPVPLSKQLFNNKNTGKPDTDMHYNAELDCMTNTWSSVRVPLMKKLVYDDNNTANSTNNCTAQNNSFIPVLNMDINNMSTDMIKSQHTPMNINQNVLSYDTANENINCTNENIITTIKNNESVNNDNKMDKPPKAMLSPSSVKVMNEWFISNKHYPYPSATAVESMAKEGRISPRQVRKWFANRRVRTGFTKEGSSVSKRGKKVQMGKGSAWMTNVIKAGLKKPIRL